MRPKEEWSLVRYANSIIVRFGRFMPVALYCDGHEFFQELCKRNPVLPEIKLLLEIEKVISEMNNLNLGGIVGLRLANKGEYEKCALLQTLPVSQTVDTTIFCGGHRQLVQLATPVVVAAIYDILKTEGLMATENLLQRTPGSYILKPGMVHFIKTNRAVKAV